MRPCLGFMSAVLTAAIPAAAGASPINARVSQAGLDFVRDRALELVPSRIELPSLKVDMWACDGEDASFELREAGIDVTVHRLSLTLPAYGTLRAEVDLTLAGTGKAHFEKLYACYGRETCDATVQVRHARVTLDLKPDIDTTGSPRIQLTNLGVQLEPDDVELRLSSCPEDDIVNLILEFVTDYGLKLGMVIGRSLAEREVGPLLEQLLDGLLSYRGNAGTFMADLHFLDFVAALTDVHVAPGELSVSGDLDLTSRFPPAACLPGGDPGEPGAFAGPAPNLALGGAAHLGVAVNLGLVQDALYHVWREGLMCVTPDQVTGLGIDLEALDHIADLLPGFPEGTRFTFEARVREPPRIEGSVANAARLRLHVEGIVAQLIALLPDQSTRTLTLDLDASMAAEVVLDPRINALAMQVEEVSLDRMSVMDHIGLEDMGFDLARVRQLVEDEVMPELLGQLGHIPLTGPVFGGFAGLPIYVVVKELRTTPAYVAVGADLFKAPEDDREPPTTTIDAKPTAVVRPADAVLLLGGSDRQIPTPLLRYRVIVDGKPAEPTFVRRVAVGEDGKSGRVQVVVHAMDLAGNQDPRGAVAEIDVDGVLPQLRVLTPLRGTISELRPTVAWTASDDRTPAEAIAARVVVTEIGRTAVSSEDVAAGATELTLDGLAAGKQYSAVITIHDQAGNAASSTMIFSVSPDAGGGCAVGGHAGTPLLVIFVLVFGALSRGWASSRPTGAARRRCRGSRR